MSPSVKQQSEPDGTFRAHGFKPPSSASRREARHLVAIIVGFGLFSIGAALGVKVAYFYFHEHSAAASLLGKFYSKADHAQASKLLSSTRTLRSASTASAEPTASSCAASESNPSLYSSSSGPMAAGVLDIPQLGLEAPVVQGDSNAALDIAIGHLETSVWPGNLGTSVLAAHNVSWFSHIDQLKPGSLVKYTSQCGNFTYAVTGAKVVASGSTLYSAPKSTLVLETCYPLDALWYTSKRYLVSAKLVSFVPSGQETSAAAVPALQNGFLAQTSSSNTASLPGVPLGRLSFTGTPAASWEQSLGPITSEKSIVSLYQLAIQASETANAGQWNQLTDGQVPMTAAAALEDSTIARYDRAFSLSLAVSGFEPQTATAYTSISIGGSHSGTYSVHFTASFTAGHLVITGFSMQLLQ